MQKYTECFGQRNSIGTCNQTLTFNIYRIDVTKTKASGLETNCFLLVESFPGDRHGPSALHQIVRLSCKSPYE